MSLWLNLKVKCNNAISWKKWSWQCKTHQKKVYQNCQCSDELCENNKTVIKDVDDEIYDKEDDILNDFCVFWYLRLVYT